MKKTQLIELLNNIKTTFVSFFSIFMFVTLAVALFTGVSFASKDMAYVIDNMIEVNNFHDAQLMYTYGFDFEDLSLFNDYEVEGYHSSYEFFKVNDNRYQTVVYELPNNIDTFIEYEGTLPSRDDEIVVDKNFSIKNNIKIGDYIEFEDNYSKLTYINSLMNYDIENDDLSSLNIEEKQFLKNRRYKVTALAYSSIYFSRDDQIYGVAPTNQINVNCYMYVNDKAFNMDAYNGYTTLLLRNHNFDGISTFSDEYVKLIEDFSDIIDSKLSIISDSHNKKIDNKISDIKEYASNLIEDAKIDINDAEIKISSNKKKLDEAKIELENAKNLLDEADDDINDAENEFNSKADELNSFKNQYSQLLHLQEIYSDNLPSLVLYLDSNGVFDSIKQIVNNNASTQDYNTVSQIIELFRLDPNTNLGSFNTCLQSIISKFSNELDGAFKDIQRARDEVYLGYVEYYDGLAEYNRGVIELRNAQIDLDKAKEDLAKAIEDYDAFEKDTSEIENGKSSGLYRKQNSSIIVSEVCIHMFSNLRYSMTSLFVVVGLLVCYSAISRIVADHTNLIGTKKALGINKRSIIFSYLSYTFIAAILGCFVGGAIGYYVIERIFIDVFSQNFTVKTSSYFSIDTIIQISFVEIVLLLLSTYVACIKILRKNTVVLLKGESESSAKQRFFEKSTLWNKLSLLTKTIINNFINDYTRVFATLVGIAGCTALIVTAFTFYNNTENSFKYQYDNVFHFKHYITYDSKTNARQEISSLLDEYNIQYDNIYKTRMIVKYPDGNYNSTHTLVFDDEDSFSNMVNIIPYGDNNGAPYKGLWLSSSYNNYYDVPTNSNVSLTDFSGNNYDFTINGYFIHYLTNAHLFIDKNTYTNISNSDYENNVFMINSDNVDIEALCDDLKLIDGYLSIEDFYTSTKNSFDAIAILSNIMVIVYVILSIVMSLLVSLNLFILYINEKKNELIVLMINGFSIKDAKRYIYTDTIFLTIIGTILGVIVGSIVGNASISSFETFTTMLIKGINVQACIIGVIGSIVLNTIISIISLRRISKFRLADINKV